MTKETKKILFKNKSKEYIRGFNSATNSDEYKSYPNKDFKEGYRHGIEYSYRP